MVDPNLITAVGILGMLFLVAAWIPQTLRTIRTKKVGISRKYLYAYLVGSAILAAYAYLIGDMIFFTLNSLAAMMDFINLAYFEKFENKGKSRKSTRKKRKRRRKK